jgi:hypothetical protein
MLSTVGGMLEWETMNTELVVRADMDVTTAF